MSNTITTSNTQEKASIDRRTVLKGLGVGSAATLIGVPTLSGSALASHGPNFHLYTVTPSTPLFQGEAQGEYSGAGAWRTAFQTYGITNQKLLILSDIGDVEDTIALDPQNIAGDVSTQVLQVATISFNPSDGLLYGIANQNGPNVADLTRSDPVDSGTPETGKFVFTLDPSDGDVTLIGGPNPKLQYIWGSTFNTDGSTFYAQSGGLGPEDEENTFFEIDVDESTHTTTVTVIGDIEDALGLGAGDPGVEHTGLSWNKLAPQYNAVGILGNFSASGTKDDLIEIDPDSSPLDAQIASSNVFASGELVSSAFNPCVGADPDAQRVYSIRNGNEFFTADVTAGSVGTVSSLATITADADTLVVVDNLAEDLVVCATVCTRTIGYWKNHDGCAERPGKSGQKGKSNKATILSVLEGCGGIYYGDGDNSDGDADGRTFDADCDAVEDILEILDEANAKEMEDMLLAQLLAAKLNVCNGATTSTGMGFITDTIDDADEWFAEDGVVDGYDDINDVDYPGGEEEERALLGHWKDELDGYNNQNLALSCEEDE